MSTADSSVQLPPLPVIDGIEFRHVYGFPGYCADSTGNVWTCIGRKHKGVRWARTVVTDTWSKLRSWIHPVSGQVICNVHRNATGKRRTITASLLVLLAFSGPKPSSRHECCHWDDIPTNNAPSNLRWGTRSDNLNDAVRNGRLVNRGERNGRAKIAMADADAIRCAYSCGNVKQKDIASKYGITQSLVSMIVLGKVWAKE